MKAKLLSIHKLIVIIPAVVHLILIPNHTSAIYSLFSQLCSFAMFMFILVGLACFFNATRTDSEVKIKQLILSIVCLLVAITFGAWLCTFYLEGLADPLVRDKAAVTQALIISISIIGCYTAGLVLLIMAKFMNLTKKEKNQEKL